MGPASVAAVRARLRNLRYGLLLVPGMLAFGLVAASAGLTVLERRAGPSGFDVIFNGGGPAARTTLSVVAGATASIAGIAFSITIVALQLVSQQFSPRALRTFMADRVTQVMSGTLLGTFGFALVTLRVVRDGTPAQGPFVPSGSVSVAILLGLISLAVLILFVHHMARVIQVSEIAAEIARTTLSSLGRLYPEPFGEGADEDPDRLSHDWSAESAPRVVHASRPGYVQAVALDDLPARLGGRAARVHIPVAPGDFVTLADPIAEIWPGDHEADLARVMRAAVVVGSGRDIAQDTLYGVRQLADIAIKGMSPSMNDPSTAWTAIRYIQAILERLAGRALPAAARRYGAGDGEVLVAVRRAAFEDYIDVGIVQIARYATRDARIAGALLEALASVAEQARRAGAQERLRTLLAAADGIAADAAEQVLTSADRRAIAERADRVRRAACGASAGRDAPERGEMTRS